MARWCRRSGLALLELGIAALCLIELLVLRRGRRRWLLVLVLELELMLLLVLLGAGMRLLLVLLKVWRKGLVRARAGLLLWWWWTRDVLVVGHYWRRTARWRWNVGGGGR
jgi:hypothetical protein